MQLHGAKGSKLHGPDQLSAKGHKFETIFGSYLVRQWFIGTELPQELGVAGLGLHIALLVTE